MSDQCLLNIVVSPAIEDSVTDWLLTQDELPGFTSIRVSGHGASTRGMTLSEQVAGHRNQILFQAHMSVDAANRLFDGLRQKFVGSGLHYWLLPVIDAGRID